MKTYKPGQVVWLEIFFDRGAVYICPSADERPDRSRKGGR